MKLIFFYLRAKKVFLLIKSIFIVLNLLDDDECISYSTLYLNFFHIILLWVLSTRSTPFMTNWKKECAGCDIIQLLSYIPCAFDHNPCFFYPNFAFSKGKELFFLFQLGGTLRGNHQHPFGLSPFRPINHISSSFA